MEKEHFEPAGFWIRLIALLFDVFLILFPASLILSLLLHADSESVERVLAFIYSLLLPVIWTGYTVGKRFCRIRIIRKDGENVHLGNMLLRYVLANVIYSITLGIALVISLFMVIFREDKRALHDVLAGTWVIHVKDDS